MTARVLILGGTVEARAVAAELTAGGVRVISSLAGRVTNPRLPVGEVRVGGFGGPEALARWLADEQIGAVLDATHPFAQRISASATAAARCAGIPLLRLERPGWEPVAGDRWHWVDDLDDAAVRVRELGARRVLLSTGRQGLGAFAADDETWFLIRCVDPPDVALPPRHEILLDRGPYTVDGELGLIDRHRLDLIATKNSGGRLTEAKLHAARRRGLPVVIVRRPPAAAGVPTVSSPAAAADWAARQ